MLMASAKVYGVIIGVAAAIATGVLVSVYLAQVSIDQELAMEIEHETAGTESSEKLKVIGSFFPYYEFARNVAGDEATVTQMIPAGVEAHDWEPDAAKIVELNNADVFVFNGLGMETYLDSIIESDDYDHIVFVNASQGIPIIDAQDDEHGEDAHEDEFKHEIMEVLEEFDEGHISHDAAVSAIEDIVSEHEGDGHDHGTVLESVEEVLHGIAEQSGHTLEDIHEIVEEGHDDHEKHEDEHDTHEDEGHEEGHDEEHEEGHDDHDDGGHGHAHDHGFTHDPHIWLDPILVKQQVETIGDALAEADPDNAEAYSQNVRAYHAELDAIDSRMKTELANCQKDTFVPFHNAFEYFAQRYNLGVVAIGGLAPDAEASAQEIARFADYVNDNDIGVIFAEDLIDPRLAEAIAEETSASVMILSPMEGRTAEEVAQGVTYIDKMNKNIDALKIALECQ